MKTFLFLSITFMAFLLPAFGQLQPVSDIVTVRTSSRLSSEKAHPGDTWTGSIADDIKRDGQLVIARGTPVRGVVDSIEHGSAHVAPSLSLKLTWIGDQAVNYGMYEPAVGNFEKRSTTKTVVGWSLAGALVGGILHGGKGAAVGAGAGAGIGALRGRGGKREPAIIQAESIVRFQAH